MVAPLLAPHPNPSVAWRDRGPDAKAPEEEKAASEAHVEEEEKAASEAAAEEEEKAASEAAAEEERQRKATIIT